MGFEDAFSKQARLYARFRPHYPAALFEYLSYLAPDTRLAWDCGTGSGQAALGLARYFDQVWATDASDRQIDNASQSPNITYQISRVENVRLGTQTVDLVTAAQAVHWFSLDPFYDEVRRVLKPRGVVAFWCYHLFHATDEIDQIMKHFYFNVVGPYWALQVQLATDGYRDLPFPFKELEAPAFGMETNWNLSELLGYLHSWSSTQKYVEQRGSDPVDVIYQSLLDAWGPPETRRIFIWPLHIRIGREEF